MPTDSTPLTIASFIGIAFGLAVLVRGMAGQRRVARISDTASSTISSIAVGEVRISGVVEAAEVTLISPLQSRPCVYYRAHVAESQGRTERTILDDELAVGFRVRDASGEVRVFPRGARFLVPDAYHDRTGIMGDDPPGLRIRTGGPFGSIPDDPEAQVAELLTVHPAGEPATLSDGREPGTLVDLFLGAGGRRDYREARIEPGDVVTLVGLAVPFDQLSDPETADAETGNGLDADGGIVDPEVAADLAEARAEGGLETDPAAAWGNAAIPGFGIGRPARAPVLDPAATPLPIATTTEVARAERRFDIPPETLVVAAAPGTELLVSLGTPGAAVAREEGRFLIGLLGAIVAIVSAVALATSLSGGILG